MERNQKLQLLVASQHCISSISSPFTFGGTRFVALTQPDLQEGSNAPCCLGPDVAQSLLFLVCLRRTQLLQNYLPPVHFRTRISFILHHRYFRWHSLQSSVSPTLMWVGIPGDRVEMQILIPEAWGGASRGG